MFVPLGRAAHVYPKFDGWVQAIGVSRGGALGAEAPRTRGADPKKKGEKKKEKERWKEKEKEKERKKESQW